MEYNIQKMKNAVKYGQIETVKELLDQDKSLINVTTIFGTWLHLAAEKGQVEIAEYLIEAGIDINEKAEIGNTSAICEAIQAENLEIVKMLIKHNVRLDTSNAKNNPLFDAIDTGNLEIVKCLIETGIDYLVKYNLSYGEVDAYKYSTIYGTDEITEYLESKMTEEQRPILEKGKKEKRIYDKSHERNLEEAVLKELFAQEIIESVKYFVGKYSKESIFAMSYRMYYDNCEPEDRYQCEIIIQTKEGYQEQCEDEEDILDYKYVPEEYKYAEQGGAAFEKTSDYLFQNCLNVEICAELEDEKEQEQMEEAIRKENYNIERIFAETVAELRKENIFTNKEGAEFYVFPYVAEDDEEERIISSAKIMNQGLDMREYIEYFKKTQ